MRSTPCRSTSQSCNSADIHSLATDGNLQPVRCTRLTEYGMCSTRHMQSLKISIDAHWAMYADMLKASAAAGLSCAKSMTVNLLTLLLPNACFKIQSLY